MEPFRGPQYRTALLPWEQQFCETLGITSDQYFEFHDLVTQHVKEEQGRELVPDIRNEATTIAIVSLVIGVASTAVSLLLAPKPQMPDEREREAASEDRPAGTKQVRTIIRI